MPRSPITTHVLDTCLGRPAAGVAVSLCRLAPGSDAAWEPLARGVTNADGRCTDLLPPAAVQPLAAGRYRIAWDVAEYQARCAAAHPAFFATPEGGLGARRFYPAAAVEFEVQAHQVGCAGRARRPGTPAACEACEPRWRRGRGGAGCAAAHPLRRAAAARSPPGRRTLPRAADVEPVWILDIPRLVTGRGRAGRAARAGCSAAGRAALARV